MFYNNSVINFYRDILTNKMIFKIQSSLLQSIMNN